MNAHKFADMNAYAYSLKRCDVQTHAHIHSCSHFRGHICACDTYHTQHARKYAKIYARAEDIMSASKRPHLRMRTRLRPCIYDASTHTWASFIAGARAHMHECSHARRHLSAYVTELTQLAACAHRSASSTRTRTRVFRIRLHV
jgi:acyl-CoA reductase-like NAD-dependent aldehyde dehydrogenase